MTTINTNVASLLAINHLTKNTADLNQALERLASGLRINKGKDDPAGLIASEHLRTQINGIQQAINNSSRASNFLGTAEGALQEVSSLLNELQSLVVETANSGALSGEEIKANQLQVDAILESINRISDSTTFNGVKLLDGTYDYKLSGVATSAIGDLHAYAATVPAGGSLPVVVEVTASAEFGRLTFAGAGTSAANTVSIRIAGNAGAEVITFAASTPVSAMMAAINQFTDATGVSATVSAATGSAGGDALFFNSTGFGADAFVSVEPVEGDFAVTGGSSSTRDYGQDASVLVNGQSATVEGLTATVRSTTLDLVLQLTPDFGQTLGSSNFSITGGGADFQLAPQVSTTSRSSLAIPAITTGTLGSEATGYLFNLGTGGDASLSSGNSVQAQQILDAAVTQVAVIRGRLGAFEKTILDPNVNSLQVTLENVTASESAIRDADFATETAALTRAQVLVQANTAVLALANSMPKSVLNLLQ
ncbi:MAG: hypothetical protein BIFFINMI_01332 [Phycisphaerae bacterium]|nr:hypothetical protein [Phycisphaerae bacterium]